MNRGVATNMGGPAIDKGGLVIGPLVYLLIIILS
jgi:hypothetical protein